MAFGGVATDNMNAQEDVRVATSRMEVMSILPARLAAAKMGNMTWVVAVLLVISVRKIMMQAMPSSISGRGISLRNSSWLPTQPDRPECCMP